MQLCVATSAIRGREKTQIVQKETQLEPLESNWAIYNPLTVDWGGEMEFIISHPFLLDPTCWLIDLSNYLKNSVSSAESLRDKEKA
jgi:hypothetical protein